MRLFLGLLLLAVSSSAFSDVTWSYYIDEASAASACSAALGYGCTGPNYNTAPPTYAYSCNTDGETCSHHATRANVYRFAFYEDGCPDPLVPNPETGECEEPPETCPDPVIYPNDDCACGPGQLVFQGKCADVQTCPNGQAIIDDEYQSCDVPDGACPDGQYYYQGSCYSPDGSSSSSSSSSASSEPDQSSSSSSADSSEPDDSGSSSSASSSNSSDSGDGEGSSSSGSGGNGDGYCEGDNCGEGSYSGGNCSKDAQTPPECDGDAIGCAVATHTWMQECKDKLWREELEGTDEYRAGDSLLSDSESNEIVEQEFEFSGITAGLDDSGFATASCPEDVVINTSLGSFTIPFMFICGWAEKIRPLVIALGWLSAALIILGKLKD